jgi:hypothetical protein
MTLLMAVGGVSLTFVKNPCFKNLAQTKVDKSKGRTLFFVYV